MQRVALGQLGDAGGLGPPGGPLLWMRLARRMVPEVAQRARASREASRHQRRNDATVVPTVLMSYSGVCVSLFDDSIVGEQRTSRIRYAIKQICAM